MAKPKTLTPEQVKARFISKGIDISAWAKEHGFRRHAVYQVLGGFTKAKRGKAHQIAVALGIKEAPEQPLN